MGKASKDKGYRGENNLRRLLQDAEVLGWQLSPVKNYARLKNICDVAWEKVSEVMRRVKFRCGDDETSKVSDVTFTENLLRNITSLTDEQQTELVSKLAKNNKYKKADFKKDAAKYKVDNEIAEHIQDVLYELDEESQNNGILGVIIEKTTFPLFVVGMAHMRLKSFDKLLSCIHKATQERRPLEAVVDEMMGVNGN